MVSGVTTGSQVGVVSMTAVRYAQPAAGEPILPVRPAQMVAATFRHIQVRPDSRLDNGIPIYKLKILDTLIDHLSARQPAAGGSVANGSAASGSAASGSAAAVNAATIDSVIMEMSRGMRGAFQAGSLPAPGAFVNLVA
ncbi:MAG TPA: hypothetical protein VMQ10_11935 [Spirochaetia bacterium]|nr:hypothetical protein [Spirochaetia bacterium]